MISGATLMGYRSRYSTREFLKKRTVRVFLPFVFWSVVAYSIHALTKGGEIIDLIRLPYDILSCRYMSIYWFFLPLFAWYLMLPLYSKMLGNRRLIEYLIFLGIIISSCSFVWRIFGYKFNENINIPALGGVTLLMIIGHYLDAYTMPSKQRVVLYLLGIICLGVHYLGTDIMSKSTVSKLFKGYTTIICIVYSSAVFVFVKEHMDHVPNWCKLAIEKIRSETFGVYLLHAFIVYSVFPLIFDNDVMGTLLFRVGATIATFVFCVLISKLFHSIRWTSWML